MKTHQFQSITEEQWKSGLSRHKCALCSFDYGDPIHCPDAVSSFPLVVVIEDCHIPEYADEILKLVEAGGVETANAVMHALCVYAEMKLRGSRLN